MTLAIDPTSPVSVKSDPTSVGSLTTAAFVPPAGSILVGAALLDTVTSTDTNVFTTATGSTSAWTVVEAPAIVNGLVDISWASVTSSVSTSVKTTNNNAADTVMKCYVFTGAEVAAPIGTHGHVTISSTPQIITITPTVVGSIIIFGVENDLGGDITIAGTTTDGFLSINSQGKVAHQSVPALNLNPIAFGVTGAINSARVAWAEIVPAAVTIIPTGPPPGPGILIEFTPNVWTDVTADADDMSGFSIKFGRTSEFTAPQIGTMTGPLLNNMTGKYTPGSQVLKDGTANPNYPNVVPGKRIRYVNTASGIRFTGYITGWPPFVDQNGTSWVALAATDRGSQLARVTLNAPLGADLLVTPDLSWPCTDAAGVNHAAEANGRQPLTPNGISQFAPLVIYGAPGIRGGTSLKFVPSAGNLGMTVWAPLAPLDFTAFTIEMCVNVGSSLPAWGRINMTVLGFDNANSTIAGLVYLNAGIPSFQDSTDFVNGSTSIVGGGWHHVAVSRTAAGGPVTLYVDGVVQGATGSSSSFTAPTILEVGEDASPNTYTPSRFQGSVAYINVYTSAVPAARIADHAAAISGYAGDTTDVRIARWLADAGLSSTDWDLDPGVATVGPYPQAGKDILTACQDMAVTEGGGAAAWIEPNGKFRFANRVFRENSIPVMTLDAEADLDGSTYAPSFDWLTLLNSSTVTRADDTGTALSVQTYTDMVSVAASWLISETVTSYADTDLDAFNLAQSRVAVSAYPGFRFGQVAVDFSTTTNTLLYSQLANVQIGSRLRITNLPVAQAPSTQVDVIVEGWTETVTPESYRVVWDTSPADNPARGVYDDPAYGRYQCDGQTLHTSLTNAGTTVVVDTAVGKPTFTTSAGQYPLQIMVGCEVITLGSAPGGSSSPQTFTGCTRGAAGTSKSAQASGSVVTLFPLATYAL